MTRGAAFGLAVFTALNAGTAACALFVGIDEIVYRDVDAGDEAEGGAQDGRIGGDGSSSGPQRDASFADTGTASDSSSDDGSDGGSDSAWDVGLDAPCSQSAQCSSGCCCNDLYVCETYRYCNSDFTYSCL
jgi:hypothetical protein